MKKRILFVDDDAMALKGMERLLRPMREEWDMEFVEGGIRALESMALQPAHVIVSDMRMPGMNGAQLLNEVMQSYPRTVRLILSGYADRDMIMKCVGSTHQYLAKPCEPKSLKMTLLRAARMDQTLDNEGLRKLVTRCSNLPSVPGLYSKVVEALQDPEVDTDTIGNIIGQDMAMTAMLLKVVNSAYFGRGFAIASTSEAVSYLGTETIKSLLLFTHAFSQGAKLAEDNMLTGPLWFHALQTAKAAEFVASCVGAEKKSRDEAYVAGLLHDLGKLILITNFHEEYQEVLRLARKEQLPVNVAEQRIFGADHADVGGYLLGLWGLPVPVVEAITLHHKPEQDVQKTFSPLTAVHAGNMLASTVRQPWSGLPVSHFNMNYMDLLGLKDRVAEWSDAWQEQALDAAPAA